MPRAMFTRACDACGSEYTAKSKASKFCRSKECDRARARGRKRKERTGDESGAKVRQLEGRVASTTRAALEKADRLETPAGQNALTLATKLDAAMFDSGSGVAQLAKQHLASLDVALEGVPVEADPIDRIRQGNEKRRLSVVR